MKKNVFWFLQKLNEKVTIIKKIGILFIYVVYWTKKKFFNRWDALLKTIIRFKIKYCVVF